MRPNDPIVQLVEDHRRFLARLREFQPQVREIARRGAPDSGAVAAVRSFADFLARDVDRLHGRKEEQGLFPTLESLLPAEGGPVGLLIQEHEELRGQQRAIGRAADRLESDPHAAEVVQSLSVSEGEVRHLLTDHISKEDTMLFPMAREILTERQLAEIAEVFAAIDRADG